MNDSICAILSVDLLLCPIFTRGCSFFLLVHVRIAVVKYSLVFCVLVRTINNNLIRILIIAVVMFV